MLSQGESESDENSTEDSEANEIEDQVYAENASFIEVIKNILNISFIINLSSKNKIQLKSVFKFAVISFLTQSDMLLQFFKGVICRSKIFSLKKHSRRKSEKPSFCPRLFQSSYN